MISNVNEPRVKEDICTLSRLQSDDKLAVEGGKLVISKAGWLQGITRVVNNIRNGGGYNRHDVTTHLNQLTQDIQRCNWEDNDDKISLYIAARRINGLEDRQSESCQKTFETISEDHSPKWDSSIDYTLMAKAIDLPYDRPAELEIDKIKALMEHEEGKLVSLAQEIVVLAGLILATLVIAVPAVFATAIKWVVWNPIEFILRGGEVTTANPVVWWCGQFARLAMKYNRTNDSAEKIQRYAHWLFVSPLGNKDTYVIPDEAVDLFCSVKQPEDFLSLAWVEVMIEKDQIREAAEKLDLNNWKFYLKGGTHVDPNIWPVSSAALLEIRDGTVTLADRQRNMPRAITWNQYKRIEQYAKEKGISFRLRDQGVAFL